MPSGASPSEGGGLANAASNGFGNAVVLDLAHATFYGNSAGLGGGLHNRSVFGNCRPKFNNVTFSGNSANNRGGAMFGTNGQTVTTIRSRLNNVVLWDNIANNRPEIFNEGTAQTEINDSIVSGGCPAGGICSNVIDADPLLGSLSDNGGWPPTMRPSTAGAALDAGNDATCLAEDQRGVLRPQESACDAGAVERIFPDLSVEVAGQGSVDAGGAITGRDSAGRGTAQCTATAEDSEVVTLILTPAFGWQPDSVSGCNGERLGNNYTTADLRADCTVEVTFAANQYAVTPQVVTGSGSTSPGNAQTVDHGGSVEFTLTPDPGWGIDEVTSTCAGTLSGSTYTASPITADCTVGAAFIATIDGQCGSADGDTFTSEPTANLCAAGQPGEVLGTGPWYWVCQGSDGGQNASCSATYAPPIDAIFNDRFQSN